MTHTSAPLATLPSAVVDIRLGATPTDKYALSEHGRRGMVVLQLWSTANRVTGLSILAPGGVAFTHGHLQALHTELTLRFPSQFRSPRAVLLTDSLISVRPIFSGRTGVDRAVEAVRSSLLTLPDLIAQWSARYGPAVPAVQDPDMEAVTPSPSFKEDQAHG